MSTPRVLSVGQCAFDGGNIARLLRETCAVEPVAVATAAEASAALKAGGFAFVLVNRVFDTDGGSGLDLIRDIKADPATASVPVMLVSNFPEAQAEAQAAGALPGFGKASLGDPATAARLKALAAGVSGASRS